MDRAEQDKLEWVEWIIEQRKQRGWSQQLLADKAGTTRQTINDYEEYRRTKPDSLILANISLVFGEADDYLPRVAGLLPPLNNGQDPWVKKMNAKLARVPAASRAAADKMIESLAEKAIEPREIKRKPKPKIKPSTN